MIDFGDLDGSFDFYAVVTPDGRVPTLEHDDAAALNDPAAWYPGPIASLAHLSEFTLVFTQWDDAEAEFRKYRDALPEGTRIRAFSVRVEEVENAYEGLEAGGK